MKLKKTEKSLTLSKKTVANLDKLEQKNARGGGIIGIIIMWQHDNSELASICICRNF